MSLPHLSQPIRPLNPTPSQVPHWPYSIAVDGDDLVVSGYITTFGGNGNGTIDDPTDSGNTASGLNTKNQVVRGVALAIDSRLFPDMQNLDPDGYEALLGAPFPLIPFRIVQVEVTINGITFRTSDGVVDLGPGHGASKPGRTHVCDLTIPFAALFQPARSNAWLANDFEYMGTVRVIGGDKYLS